MPHKKQDDSSQEELVNLEGSIKIDSLITFEESTKAFLTKLRSLEHHAAQEKKQKLQSLIKQIEEFVKLINAAEKRLKEWNDRKLKQLYKETGIFNESQINQICLVLREAFRISYDANKHICAELFTNMKFKGSSQDIRDIRGNIESLKLGIQGMDYVVNHHETRGDIIHGTHKILRAHSELSHISGKKRIAGRTAASFVPFLLLGLFVAAAIVLPIVFPPAAVTLPLTTYLIIQSIVGLVLMSIGTGAAIGGVVAGVKDKKFQDKHANLKDNPLSALVAPVKKLRNLFDFHPYMSKKEKENPATPARYMPGTLFDKKHSHKRPAHSDTHKAKPAPKLK